MIALGDNKNTLFPTYKKSDPFILCTFWSQKINEVFPIHVFLKPDIDDCLQPKRCREDEICKNLDGGFECNCHHGYTKASPQPNSKCRDINECTETTKCSKLVNCTNSIGSYKCASCPAGYVGDGHYCNGMDIFVSHCDKGF